MRLWTLHPKYLDAPGLVALWREGLLAQAVLLGRTTGYTRHPQLIRFRAEADPAAAIASYLAGVREEALARGYRFDAGKIPGLRHPGQMTETTGQLLAEWAHLLAKLAARAPDRRQALAPIGIPEPHPLFRLVPGDRRPWEAAGTGLSGGTAGSR
jgi:hypothetical protein